MDSAGEEPLMIDAEDAPRAVLGVFLGGASSSG